MPSDTTFRLIYRSRDLIPDAERRKELCALFAVARSTNKQADICGALLLSDSALIAHVDGISPAAGRGTTPEKDEILDFMRAAARGTSLSGERGAGR